MLYIVTWYFLCSTFEIASAMPRNDDRIGLDMKLLCSAWDKETEFIDSEPGLVKLSLGIGFLEAYSRLRDFLTENDNVDEICFVGTAGAYSDSAGRVSIGDMFAIESVALLHLGVTQGLAYTPREYQFFALQLGDSDLTKATVLSSLEITASRKISDLVVQSNSSQQVLLENMELYGVAQAAQEFGIACKSNLVVSNFTFENSHQEWQEHQEESSKKLAPLMNS